MFTPRAACRCVVTIYPNRTVSTQRWIFLACYGASGAAALIYQVIWVRLFALALGHTVASSSIVLAAFMCGLALGAAIAGRLKPAPETALARYAILEVLIAVAAIALPAALSSLEPALAWAYADGTASGRFTIVRAAISFVLVGIPAAAMGATFPLAVSWLVAQTHRGRSAEGAALTGAGSLYAINTIGAAAGAIAAGFWLIPAYGVRATTWTAVVLNVGAAAGATWLLRAHRRAPPVSARSQPSKRARAKASDAEARPLLASTAAAVSGFAALVFEVSWTRLIALIIGPTTYAFALMAASFIVGIAAGSRIGVRLARTGPHHVMWLSVLLIVAAAGTLIAGWFTALQLPLIVARYVNAGTSFGPLLFREATIVGLALMASSAAFGAVFTLSLALAAPTTESAARDASRVYAANTIGAVLGALAGGFVLVPRFGLESTFLHVSRALIAAGAIVSGVDAVRAATHRKPAVIVAAIAACVLAGTFAIPEWNRALLTGGLYKYARGLEPEDINIVLRAGRLDYYKEGAAGTVSVKTLGGTRSLAIDGKVDASNGGDMLTQRLLGLLPTLAHGDPQSALVIGLGSGVTADAVIAAHPVKELDVVEISPEVVEAASFFEQENRGVLRKPGVRLLVGDGRTHLQLTSRRYDVIVSEPSNPWMAGVASLFTSEFFHSARERLTAGGVFCQWTHTYELAPDDLRSIVHTFASAFPNGTMWLVGDGDLLLIGVNGDAPARSVTNIKTRSREPQVAALLAPLGVTPESSTFFLLSLFTGGPGEFVSYGGGAALQVDDRTALEFSAPRAMYTPTEGNAASLREMGSRAARPAEIASAVATARAHDWIVRGRAGEKADAFEMAHESFSRAASLDAGSVDALRGRATSGAGMHRLADETQWLRARAAAEPANAAVRVALSYVLAMGGELDAAVSAAVDAARVAPDSPYPLEQLASVLADAGDVVRLEPVAQSLVERFPDRDDGRYYHATALFMSNRLEEAVNETARLLASSPDNARAHNLRGILCAAAKDLVCARAAFETSLRLNPRDASVYTNLGTVHLEQGNADAAIRLFSEAVAIDPGAIDAKERLRAMGSY